MRGTLVAGAALAGALAVVLSGCSSPVAEPDDVVVSAEPVSDAVDWNAEYAAFIAEFGERPPSIPAPDADAIAMAAADAERGWAAVLSSFPNAVRPGTAFVHWTTKEDEFDEASDRLTCIVDAGAVLEEATSVDGEVVTRGWSHDQNLDTMLAIYSCQYLAYPVHPTIAPGRAEWRWHLADEFTVRCLEAHDVEQPPLPSLDRYLADLESQGYTWFERWPDSETDVGPQADIYDACHGGAINGR